MVLHAKATTYQRGTRNTECGKTVPDEQIARDVLDATCGAKACATARGDELRELRAAVRVSEEVSCKPGIYAEVLGVALVLTPPDGDVRVIMDALGVDLTVATADDLSRYYHLADTLRSAFARASNVLRQREAHPDAATRLQRAEVA